MGTTPAGISSFVARRGECQEKTIVLKIENLEELLKMSNEELEENGVIFEAGYCTLNDGTQVPAIWKYSFEHSNAPSENGGVWLGGLLALHHPTKKQGVKSAEASYSMKWNSGSIRIVSFETEKKQFAGIRGYGRANMIKRLNLLQSIGRNTLNATLVLKVFSSQSFDPALEIPPFIPPVQLGGQISSDLLKMLESGDWADVEIRVPKEVGGEVNESSYTKQAHKIFLTGRSSVFAKMFEKDSTMIEAQTGKVTIQDLSPRGLEIFLRFLYTGELLQDWVHLGTEILYVADKYDCDELKKYCGRNILDDKQCFGIVQIRKASRSP